MLGTQPCWHEGYSAEFVLELPRANVGVSYNDFKKKINHYILSTWQDDWNGAAANKLHSWEIGRPPTGGAGRMKLSLRKILHLSVSTVSVF